jgi:hypothetical protein
MMGMAGVAPHHDITVLFNPTSIRDTNYWYSPAINGQGYSKRTIKVNNKLDQALIVEIEVSRDGVIWEYFEQLAASATAGQAVVFGPGKTGLVTPATPLPLWRLRLKTAGTAPTTGTVDAWCIQFSF